MDTHFIKIHTPSHTDLTQFALTSPFSASVASPPIPVCLRGYQGNHVTMSEVLTELGRILEERKSADADSSYVASLYHKGLNKILEKVGEEATETIIAAKDAKISGDNSDVIYEVADLWFHSLVMLAELGESPAAIEDELKRRFNLSGLEEKANRNK